MSDNEADESQERASRVRNRRSQRSQRGRGQPKDTTADETGEPTETESSQTPQTEQREGRAQTGSGEAGSEVEDDPTQQPIKERDHETFYLRDDLQKELTRATGQASLDFELEFDTSLEKNRHLRPLLLYLGAQQLNGMNTDEIKDILDSTDVLDGIRTTE